MEFNLDKVIDGHTYERYPECETNLSGIFIIGANTLSELKSRCENYSKGDDIYHFYGVGSKGEVMTMEDRWFNYGYPVSEVNAYETCQEMLDDYLNRFGNNAVIIKFDSMVRVIVEFDLESNLIRFPFDQSWWSLRELFERGTYLDGSQVGKRAI